MYTCITVKISDRTKDLTFVLRSCAIAIGPFHDANDSCVRTRGLDPSSGPRWPIEAEAPVEERASTAQVQSLGP